jgi:large subunit ribosomal protein L13
MHPGGLKAVSLKAMLQRQPKKVIYHAVSGMLPKNRLRAKRLKRLRIYLSSEHPHIAQAPKPVELVRG